MSRGWSIKRNQTIPKFVSLDVAGHVHKYDDTENCYVIV